MKLFKHCFILLIVFLVLVFAGTALVIQFYGKSLCESLLTQATKAPVTISNVYYSFPFGVNAEDVVVGDLMTAKEIFVQFDFHWPSADKVSVAFIEFVEPFVNIQVETEGKILERMEAGGQPVAEGPVKIKRTFHVKDLIIKQGRLKYTAKRDINPMEISLNHVNLMLNDFFVPLQSQQTSYELSGVLEDNGSVLSGSFVKGGGWVDIVRRDMKGSFSLADVDGHAVLKADITAKDNDAVVNGQVQAKDLVSITKNNTMTDSADSIVLNALSSLGVDVVSNFQFQTKLDNFHVDKIIFSGNLSLK